MIHYLIRILAEILWFDMQHVGIFETEIMEHDSYNPSNYKVWIHCYETRWGTRHAKIMIRRRSHPDPLNFFYRRRIRRDALYQTEILPWLRGRHHNNIPSYQKVKTGHWDFLKKLKGETPIILNDDEK